MFAYRHLATGDAADKATAVRLLNDAIIDVTSSPFSPGFYGGWSGVAWATAHLCHLPGWPVEGDPVARVDEAVAPLLSRSWRGNAGLVSGLTGLGVYALERLPRTAAAASLATVVNRLLQDADERQGTRCWPASGRETPVVAAPHPPRGAVDLGMAHGAAGVIALLAEAVGAGIPTARSLLDSAVNWLLEQHPLDRPGAFFPRWHAQGHPDPGAAPQGWCHGAPGMASALLQAARHTGNRTWEAAALDLAESAVATPLDQCHIIDHGLCEGAAGVAHLYNRMYQATGRESLRDGARIWFARLLDMRYARSGVGGFLTYRPRSNGGDPWTADPGLLRGAAGTALALLAAVSAVEPRWDRALLASVPPDGSRRV
ncbi:MAG: lanthionine synthetase C family protein [bacterium]|nr:lanthionine synthetase C family protein [bacterium]